ncbi:MAG: peptidoglycan DD-metalloendopeptidase family protein [Propionibacteriaceae bacterium]|nr:peptidoglycan DD-metalloendopeptidase family protein [Propionibacteriaceae bacterium]
MDVQSLLDAMAPTGMTRQRAQELLPHMETAMRAAGCTTVERAAMWCAQIGHESAGLRYMEEIADGSAYEGRRDLGNVHPGDGRRFKGSGPIQLTGRANFRAFTTWCRAQGHSTIDFEAQPHLVREQPRWGFLAASWYWTAARPQINAMADRRDLDGVTRAINGGLNGISDRRQRYQRCLALGHRILPGKAEPMKIVHPMGTPSDVWRQTSGYGMRWGSMHAGTDFGAPVGTPIYAPADGFVVQGGERARGSVSGFGSWIWLDCQTSCGRDFIFGHVHHPGILVSRGDRVVAGQQIGVVGNEGQSTGPHLHFEVWGPPGRTGGAHEDPAAWLAKHITPAALAAGVTDSEGGTEVAFTEHDRAMLHRIHHELTHTFGSRAGHADGTPSTFRDTLVGYVLEIDKKVEDIHANMLPALWQRAADIMKGVRK